MDSKAMRLAECHGIKALNIRCDVTDYAALEKLVSRVRSEFGRVDIFIANAGVCIPKGTLEQPLDGYHTRVNVNVHGVVYCARSISPLFGDRGFSNFVITAGISGHVVTIPVDHTAYNTTKAAAIQLGKSLAREWRGFARVNMVSPGWIDTEMSDDLASINEARRMAVMGRLGQVRELKAAYLYLASNASSFVTCAEITVDGG